MTLASPVSSFVRVRRIVLTGLIFALLNVSATVARADDKDIKITGVQTDYSAKTLTISVTGLDTKHLPAPKVWLAGTPLVVGGSTVDNNTHTGVVTAKLPATIPVGSFLVELSWGRDRDDDDHTFEVALGVTGTPGPPGPQGPTGTQGPQGPAGANGISGVNGRNGVDGVNGVNGAAGPQGPVGPTGASAPSGGIVGQLKDICNPNFDFTGTVVYVAGRGFTAVTGAPGSFQFDDMPPGTFDVLAERNGVVIARALQQTVGTSMLNIGDLSYPNLNADRNNCGACGVACTTGLVCTAGVCAAADGCPGDGTCSSHGVCTSGSCVCANGYTGADCSIAPPPVCPSGQIMCGATCVSTTTDPNNCGVCNAVCAGVANGTNACTNGQCGIGSCNAGFADCDNNPTNGCEVNLQNTPSSCGACGVSCGVGGTCVSGACQAAAPTCTDQVKNGNETDVDCGGGTCGLCGIGKRCVGNPDCATQACDAITFLCDSSQCIDKRKDGAETDTDCGGGTCTTCAVGKNCFVNSDCSSSACSVVTGKCVASTCLDQVKDGAETDVDCGGGTCGACAIGKKCNQNVDCVSNACDAVTLTCVASQCSDHQKDGAETDVDCGGGTCGACSVGKNCDTNFDCQSGHICNASKICQ